MVRGYVEDGPDPEEVEGIRERSSYGSGMGENPLEESEKPLEPLPPIRREWEIEEDGTWVIRLGRT